MSRGRALAMVVLGSVAAALNIAFLVVSGGSGSAAIPAACGAAGTILIAVLGARHLVKSRDE